jgi:hypothetical protein
MLLTLELVPGLLEGTVFAPEPVVLGDPVAPTFNRTIPFVSRQCVASEMAGAAEGAVPGAGCSVVCALVAVTPAAINNVVARSFVSIGRSLFDCGLGSTPAEIYCSSDTNLTKGGRTGAKPRVILCSQPGAVDQNGNSKHCR